MKCEQCLCESAVVWRINGFNLCLQCLYSSRGKSGVCVICGRNMLLLQPYQRICGKDCRNKYNNLKQKIKHDRDMSDEDLVMIDKLHNLGLI